MALSLPRHYREILIGVGKDPDREGLLDTRHMCMMMRGVEKQNSTMNTSVMLGAFRDSSNTRQEFLQLIGRSK